MSEEKVDDLTVKVISSGRVLVEMSMGLIGDLLEQGILHSHKGRLTEGPALKEIKAGTYKC